MLDKYIKIKQKDELNSKIYYFDSILIFIFTLTLFIIWGREETPNLSDPTFKQSIDTIKLLRSQIQPHIILSENPSGSHAKLCLLDETVAVVTSFNFLSIGGVPQMERMLSGELGLVINSQSINLKLNKKFL